MVTRRTFLAGNAAALAKSALDFPTLAFAATPETAARQAIIPKSERDFWNDWPRFITQKINQAGASRSALLRHIQSKEQMANRAAVVRSQLWQIIGGRPDATPLNDRTVGRIERSGYRIEKIIFESMPQVYVTAHLYLPTAGKPPYPGIVVPLGHTGNGKAYRNYQYSYQNLARKGYVVLAYDPFGQGERRQYLRPDPGHPAFSTGEHTQAGRPMILFGSGFAHYRVWDGIRALDYLLSRPEVDPQRIGCTGHSGGGTMTMYLAALDPRIHVAVPVEANFENMAGPYYEPPGAIADAEQDLVGSLRLNLDRGDLLAAFAPKPLLMSYTVHDQGQTYSPVYEEAIKENYDELSRVYALFGAQNRVELFAGRLPHELDFFQRRAMYGWFNRWFGKTDVGVEEAGFDASPDALLNCTTTGQVLTSLGGRSVVDLNRTRVKELLPLGLFRAADANPAAARKQVRSKLTQLLALPSKRTPLQARILSSLQGQKLQIDELQYESEPGIRITGWFLRPKQAAAKSPCVLFVSDGLADEAVAEPSVLDEILSQGSAVCAIHLRGIRLSTPRPPSGGPAFYSGMDLQERFAWANLVLGSPVIGQRVWDVLQALEYLRSRIDVDASQIRILGKGPAGLAALMAAALDESVRSILIDRTLATYVSVVDSEDYSLALDWFVPGILQHFDIPDIAASIYPRAVWVINGLDADGAVLSESALRERYMQRVSETSIALKQCRLRTIVDDDDVYVDWLKQS